MAASYITVVDKPFRGSGIPWSKEWSYQDAEVVIHKNWEWYFGRFPEMELVEKLLEYLGITYKFREKKRTPNNGNLYFYDLSHEIKEAYNGGFWKLSDVPKEAKPIIAHSNGSLVTCYALNDGNTVWIYRPNPNAKEVYDAMELNQHIKHCREFGDVSIKN